MWDFCKMFTNQKLATIVLGQPPPSPQKSLNPVFFKFYISPHKLVTQETCNFALTETCITKEVRMTLVLFKSRHSEPTDFEFTVIWCPNYTAVSCSLWAMLWLRQSPACRCCSQGSCTVCGGLSGTGTNLLFVLQFSPVSLTLPKLDTIHSSITDTIRS
jgi:hypothetical protein